MADKLLSESEVHGLALGDASLESIAWLSEEGPALSIVLSQVPTRDPASPQPMSSPPPPSSPRSVSLRFTWVRDLRIDLDLARSFRALTLRAVFDRVGDGRWRVTLDFAHDGAITLECEEVILAVDPTMWVDRPEGGRS